MRYIDYGLGAFLCSMFMQPAQIQSNLSLIYEESLSHGELAPAEAKQRLNEAGSLDGVRVLSDLLNEAPR
jgi:hypothetical protein